MCSKPIHSLAKMCTSKDSDKPAHPHICINLRIYAKIVYEVH